MPMSMLRRLTAARVGDGSAAAAASTRARSSRAHARSPASRSTALQRHVGAMRPQLHGGHGRSEYLRRAFETQAFLLEEPVRGPLELGERLDPLP